MRRSLIDILDLSTAEIDELIKTAMDIIAKPKKYAKKWFQSIFSIKKVKIISFCDRSLFFCSHQ